MINGYTYHKSASYKSYDRWQCSSKMSRCNAFALLDKNTETFMKVKGEHNHLPPVYKILKSGAYVKV